MDDDKLQFLEHIIREGALKIGREYTLKNGRVSPYFIDLGELFDGRGLSFLGENYAKMILAAGDVPDRTLLFGIPRKGVPIAVATSIALNKQGISTGFFFARDTPKVHGEGTAEPVDVVGRRPTDNSAVIPIDDVFSSGGTKYEVHNTLRSLTKAPSSLLAVAVDREECDDEGNDAREKYERETGTRVISIINMSDIFTYAKARPHWGLKPFADYITKYGTQRVKKML